MIRNKKRKRTLIDNETTKSPYWTDKIEQISKQLFIPNGDNCNNSNLSSYDSSSTNSWFTVKSYKNRKVKKTQRACWPSLQEVEQIQENNKKHSPNKTIKIRLFPTREQRIYLKRAFDSARWTYNQVVAALKKEKLTKQELRMKFTYNEAIKDKQWLQTTPQSIRDGALLDVLHAIKSSKAQHKKTGKSFKLKFKSRKTISDSIAINGRDWKGGVLFPRLWSKQRFRSNEPIPDKINYDCRICRNRFNQYWLCRPFYMVSVDQAPKDGVIALDPGVRTFMTGYDPDGYTHEWGVNDIKRIRRLEKYKFKLQSHISKLKGRRKRQTNKALLRMNRRIKHLIEDCHKKLAHALCLTYHTILIPEFQTSKMVFKKKRRLNKESTRHMITWSHYAFRERLKTKAKLMNAQVIIVNEDYTSKTCSRCGNLTNIGNKKHYNCKECGLSIDRDLNAAKNIYIRAHTEYLRMRCQLGPALSKNRVAIKAYAF